MRKYILSLLIPLILIAVPVHASRSFSRDFGLDCARGLIPGCGVVTKFGRNIEVDSGVTADVWDGGETGDVSTSWVAPTQARQHLIASTDGNDASGGTGARTVLIFGLTDWDTAESSETITMAGTSGVTSVSSYVIIYRIQVLTKGATASNIGTITATALTDNTITAQITPLVGQTGMAIYGIPSTQKLFIGRFYGNMNRASGAGASTGYVNLILLVNPEPQTELTNFVTRHTFGISLDGTSALTINYANRKVVDGPAIIKIQVDSGTNNMDISAGFDAYIIDN